MRGLRRRRPHLHPARSRHGISSVNSGKVRLECRRYYGLLHGQFSVGRVSGRGSASGSAASTRGLGGGAIDGVVRGWRALAALGSPGLLDARWFLSSPCAMRHSARPAPAGSGLGRSRHTLCWAPVRRLWNDTPCSGEVLPLPRLPSTYWVACLSSTKLTIMRP